MMRRSITHAIVALTLGCVVLGCAPVDDGIHPPEIDYGQDVSVGCGMIISDPAFAAGSVLKDGTVLKFDDVGDMLKFHFEHPDRQVAEYFVHDYQADAWLIADDAVFVQTDSLVSPMGYGVAAFGTREAAEAFAADRDGRVWSLNDVKLYVHDVAHGSGHGIASP